MRIVVDLDGVLCKIKEPGQSYADVKPIDGASDRLRQFRNAGHTVVIYTARNMATYEGNLGKIMKNIGMVTLKWLQKYNMEYDEIYFGKPNGQIYIDDRGLCFHDWENISLEKLVEEARDR